MACILLWSPAVRVHDPQAYRKTDVTRERISLILERGEMCLSWKPIHRTGQRLLHVWSYMLSTWPPFGTVLTDGIHDEFTMILVWFQRSGDRNLLNLIAANTSCNQWLCPLTYFEGFVQNLPALTLLPCFISGGKHDGHSSSFSCEILFVTFWLAEAARVIGSPDPSIDVRY